jgi:SAM-dependent methyltransferase
LSSRTAQGSTAKGEAVWQDVECGPYRADLPLWLKLADEAGVRSGRRCEVLELGCGNGRVSLALARRGHNVTGLDLDPELLAVFRERAEEQDLTVGAELGDVRHFQLDRRFDLALAPMQLAQLLPTAWDRLTMLCCLARHLRPQARAAVALLDLRAEPLDGQYSPSLPDTQEIEGWVYSSQPVDVKLVEGGNGVELDRVRQAVSPKGAVHESFSRIRLETVSPVELERTARLVRLSVERREHVPATRDYTASAVVVLRKNERTGRRGRLA